jgi:hypothetical protein
MPRETATIIAGWRLPARLPRAPPGGEPDGPGSRQPQAVPVRGPRRAPPCTRAQLGALAGHRSGEPSSSVLHRPAVRHRVVAPAVSRAGVDVATSLRSLPVPAAPSRACCTLATSLRSLPVPADSVSGRLAGGVTPTTTPASVRRPRSLPGHPLAHHPAGTPHHSDSRVAGRPRIGVGVRRGPRPSAATVPPALGRKTSQVGSGSGQTNAFSPVRARPMRSFWIWLVPS